MKARLLAALCLLVALSAHGQTTGVAVNVPFGFSVEGKQLPAGQYRLLVHADKLDVQDSQNKTLALVFVNSVAPTRRTRPNQVVFDCYRERCFLAQVWAERQEFGRQLMRSRIQNQVARQQQGTYFALLGTSVPK